MLTTFAIAISVGLLSSLHCLGMCGGISGMLTMSLPGEVRNDRPALSSYLGAYNAGRLTSYVAAGAIVGTLGTGVIEATAVVGTGHLLLKGIGAAMLAAIGLYVAGWFPALAVVEGAGTPIWRHLEPVGRRLLPARNLPQAYLQGVVWGWLPCGLMYSTLLWAFASGGTINGIAVMAGFGLGTLPMMMSSGLVAKWLTELGQIPYLRQMAGSAIVLVALLSLVYSGTIGDAICVAYGTTP